MKKVIAIVVIIAIAVGGLFILHEKRTKGFLDRVSLLRFTADKQASITEVQFLKNFKNAPSSARDVSTKDNRSVLAWTASDGKDGLVLYIAARGGVKAVYDTCDALFADFTGLRTVYFSGNFDTTRATSMGSMFANCSSLASIDMRGMSMDNVRSMGNMFAGCTNLTSVTFRDVKTPKLDFLGGMFYNCSNLYYVDLSGLDTSNVTSMERMFYGCRWLSSLDLTSFDARKVRSVKSMFSNCTNLRDLYFSRNFILPQGCDDTDMFYRCTGLTIHQ